MPFSIKWKIRSLRDHTRLSKIPEYNPLNEFRSGGVVCAAPRRSIPAMRSGTTVVNVSKKSVSFVNFMVHFLLA